MAVMVMQDTVCVLERNHFTVKSDRLTSVVIDSLPAKGMLCYDGNRIQEAGVSISAVDILIGNLTFTPDPGECGGSYAMFDYTSQTGTGLQHHDYLILDVVPSGGASSGEGRETQAIRH